MIKIEFEQPTISTCECCGGKTTRLTRFVYQDDEAFAVYYIMFTESHEHKYVEGLIGIGEWGEESKQENRTAFPFRIWATEENYQVGLMDASESPWKEVTFLGKILDREEGLKSQWLKDVFHITDHIVTDDKVVIDFLTS